MVRLEIPPSAEAFFADIEAVESSRVDSSRFEVGLRALYISSSVPVAYTSLINKML